MSLSSSMPWLSRHASRCASFLMVVALAWVAGCSRVPEGTPYSATGLAAIKPGENFTEGRLAAVHLAEKLARDQILVYVMDLQFPNGVTLQEAVITDPFIQAKVYDVIRTSKITDQTVNSDGMVSVTVQLDLTQVHKILENPDYGGRAGASAKSN